VELLRAKLEQANNKNDVLRENYEMIDTKLSQVFIGSAAAAFISITTNAAAGRGKNGCRLATNRTVEEGGAAAERGDRALKG
jgi:hypothetical protein